MRVLGALERLETAPQAKILGMLVGPNASSKVKIALERTKTQNFRLRRLSDLFFQIRLNSEKGAKQGGGGDSP